MTQAALFVREALDKIKSPEILVNVVSKRVRQLGAGFRPLIEVHPKWTLMEIALKEIAEGKIEYEFIEEVIKPSVSEKPEKAKKRKRSTR